MLDSTLISYINSKRTNKKAQPYEPCPNGLGDFVTANADEDETLSASVCFRDSRRCFSFCHGCHQQSLLGLWVHRQGSRGRQTTSSTVSLSQGFLEKSQPIQIPGTAGSAFKGTERPGQCPTLCHLWKIVENGVRTQWLEKGNCCNYVKKKSKTTQELRVDQLHFKAWGKNHRASPFRSHF